MDENAEYSSVDTYLLLFLLLQALLPYIMEKNHDDVISVNSYHMSSAFATLKNFLSQCVSVSRFACLLFVA